MSVLKIINGTTPCKFSNIDAAYIQETNDKITLKCIKSKNYLDNFYEYSHIKCKSIKNKKIIKSWEKLLNVHFDNSVLFKIKLKNYSCLSTNYYTFIIEIRKNDIDIDEFGLLTMNIFQLIRTSTFTSKLCYLYTLISQF